MSSADELDSDVTSQHDVVSDSEQRRRQAARILHSFLIQEGKRTFTQVGHAACAVHACRVLYTDPCMCVCVLCRD